MVYESAVLPSAQKRPAESRIEYQDRHHHANEQPEATINTPLMVANSVPIGHCGWGTSHEGGFNLEMQVIATAPENPFDEQPLQEWRPHGIYSETPLDYQGDSRSEYSYRWASSTHLVHQAGGVFLPYQVPLASPSPTYAYGLAHYLDPQLGDLTQQDWGIHEQSSAGGIHSDTPTLPSEPRVSPLQDSHIDTALRSNDSGSGGQNTLEPTTSTSLPNSQRKGTRRRYGEIERLYACNWVGCEKAYGSLGCLNTHIIFQSHFPKRTPEG